MASIILNVTWNTIDHLIHKQWSQSAEFFQVLPSKFTFVVRGVGGAGLCRQILPKYLTQT